MNGARTFLVRRQARFVFDTTSLLAGSYLFYDHTAGMTSR